MWCEINQHSLRRRSEGYLEDQGESSLVSSRPAVEFSYRKQELFNHAGDFSGRFVGRTRLGSATCR